ncbi:MAG TPA: glycosyl hydrolase family 8 [Polyangiaceae bacterium]|nr:glycosyl hydrolase family 8 [Polyangiaceae bacterium]
MRAPIPRSLAGGAFASTIALVAIAAHGQSKPFPTSGHYKAGFLPSAATATAAMASYQNWKAKYLKGDCGSGLYRVDNATGDSSTFSEGQGYGMVLTAYFGDKSEFDGLWAFAKKSFDSKGVMGWHVTCAGPASGGGTSNSATDGDTDIAFGLVVASVQWGGPYTQDAMNYLATLKSVDFTTCSPTGRIVPTAGSWQTAACTTGDGGSNTSYWMPAYYRVFAAVTGDTFWSKAADDVVTLYGLAADPTTGIIVNEVDQMGAPVSGQTYDYNSCRIPWRAALDYLWFGTPAVQSAMTKLSTWANSIGITHVVDGYKADGTATGSYTGLNAFVGGFAVGAMADSQAVVDTFGTYFVSIANDNGTYYGSSLRTLYLLTLSGDQWNPMDNLGDGGAGPPAGDAGSGPPAGDSGSAAGGDSDAGSSGGGGSSGAGGGSSGAGAGSGDSGASDAGGEASASAAAHSGSGGCGCRVGGRRRPPIGASILAIAALGVGVGRRRASKRGTRRGR